MRWLDNADVALAEWHAKGVDLQVVARDEWLAMAPADRTTVGPSGGRVVRDVAYRGDDAGAWLLCARVDMTSDSWVLWDMRDGEARAVVMAGPIPDRQLALSLGRIAAESRVARVVLGGFTVLTAAAMALRETVRRERARRA